MKKSKKLICLAIAIAIAFCCVRTAAAADVAEDYSMERATGSFNTTVEPGVIAKRTEKLSLEAGEVITIKAIYTPYFVRVDFGLIDSDGIFYYITVDDGVIDEKIEVEERGNYTFAIRNNGNVDIEVSGYVTY